MVLFALRAPNPLLYVGLKNAEGGFVALDRQLQDVQQPFCSVQVGHNPLGYHDRLRRHTEWLRIDSEIDEQLLWCARHTTKIGVAGCHLGLVHLDLRRPRLLRCLRFGSRLAHAR